jgi:pimeloyl-ACP methyl ester carboxylesterase
MGSEPQMQAENYDSHFITAQDGLKLHVRAYGSRETEILPLVCLPGLARTAADFHALAVALSSNQRRYVIALDYRGRGRSDYDDNADNYSFAVEVADLLAVITALGIGRAVFLGTSRGGILTLLLATQRPTAIAGVILNDIGPVVETQGLMRIKSYVGKLPQPRNFEEGGEILRRLFATQFPRLTAENWLEAAKRTWETKGGQLVPTYDIRLAKTLEGINPGQTLPPFWKEFDALARIPLLVLRGANSDILSAETITAMRARRSAMDVIEVPDQGHTPLLAEPDIIERIGAFVASCDAPRGLPAGADRRLGGMPQ